MFVIRELQRNQYFRKESSKVIVFDNPQEASAFANAFYNFAIMHAMRLDPQLVFEVMDAMQTTKVEELPAEYDFEIINFNDLKTH